MILPLLLLATGAAFAAPAPPAKPLHRSPEETLAVMLSKLRQDHATEMRKSVLGGAEELRDAVAADSGAGRKKLADRLPGMSPEPYNLCRSLAACMEAPVSLHVEETALADDAFLALARPWLKLQEARGKTVKLTVEAGVGVRLELEDLPRWPVVTLAATPAPTGGLDVAVEDGPGAARAFALERDALLPKKQP
jgi:hypothetical protein